MSNLTDLIYLLREIMVNPWLLVFSGVWVIGYMIKEHTKLDNRLIPWIVLTFAIALSLLILETSIAGFIVGMVIGYIQIGMYEHIKNIIEFYKERIK